MHRIRISGFERGLAKHGIAILDRQLRRLSLNPNDILIDKKTKLVKDLGGHPLAIIFCADAIYDEGLTVVTRAVEQGAGFYREITDRILNVVALSEKDERLLRILSGCRIEAPRDAIASACDFPAADHISNLGRQCLIEIVSPSTIRLPGVLRNRFRFNDLDIDTRNSLHKHASRIYSQMAKEYPSRANTNKGSPMKKAVKGKVSSL